MLPGLSKFCGALKSKYRGRVGEVGDGVITVSATGQESSLAPSAASDVRQVQMGGVRFLA